MLSLVDVPLVGDRSPLNVKRVGTIQQEGFRIEKLYYESLPGLYVPADLYIPDKVTTPVPAILYQCGHSRTQKVHYQPHARRFAELGFVCLIVETIQWGEVYGEHWGCYSRGWFNWYSRGYTPCRSGNMERDTRTRSFERTPICRFGKAGGDRDIRRRRAHLVHRCHGSQDQGRSNGMRKQHDWNHRYARAPSMVTVTV
jgi:hypothetical protein